MSSNDQNRSKKILVPLATMAVAATVVVGSGATWTTTTHSSITATSGNIKHTNNQNGATLQIANLKPGDVSTGSLTIVNDGTIDSKVALTSTGATDSFYKGGPDGILGNADDKSDLQLAIQRNGVEFWKGDVQKFPTTDFGQAAPLAAGKTDTFTFVVTLNPLANDASQKKAAGIGFDFTTSPVDGNPSVSNVWGLVN